MSHHFPPPAPPPPVPMPHGSFPAMGMDQLADDFQGTRIETIEPRFNHGSFDERPAKPARGINFRRASDGNTKTLTSYEGYTFTKVKAEHAGQKETWAVARKTAMPVSQADMKDQVAKQYKRGITGMKQFEAPEMQGYKRRQIERLIEDRSRRDDPNFEYHLASVKLETRRLRSGSYENSAMRVILKRSLRPGVPVHPAMAVTGPPSPGVEVFDLTGQEESEKSSLNSFASSPKQHGAFPFPRQHSEPWGHGGHGQHVMEDAFVPMHPGHPFGEEQVHGQRHKDSFFAEDDIHGGPPGHAGHGEKDKKHDKKERHEKHDKEEKYDKKDKKDKHDKHDKKDEKPKIIYVTTHKSDKKHHSDSSSLDSSEWDHVSRDTEDTFEQFLHSGAGKGKAYRPEKKQDKADKHKSHSHHGSRDRDEERTVYREHRRKVPEKPREVSPPLSRHYSQRPKYLYDEEVIIQPAVSQHSARDHHHDPRPRQISYSRERPQRHPQRGMSFDEEPQFDMEYESPPRSAYGGRKVARTPKAPQIDYEKETLRLELEKERREHDRTAEQLHRAASARMPAPPRERLPIGDRMPVRDRMSMRAPPIIEREPMYMPRRVEPDPMYYEDDYYHRY